MLRLTLCFLPPRARCAFWRRYQCPAYARFDEVTEWRCIRRHHRGGWHRDTRGVQWPA